MAGDPSSKLSAIVSGIKIATGDAVILLDGDLQDPPELIEAFHAKSGAGSSRHPTASPPCRPLCRLATAPHARP